MGSNFITANEVSNIVKENNLELLEDIEISIGTKNKMLVLPCRGCLHEPPFSALYNKTELMTIIKKLK